jgi:8-oxo-dGTP diphosphatase
MPDIYELPGGHIDFAEDPVAGLKREILEELHVNVAIGDPFYVFTYTNDVKSSHSIEVIYFAEFSDPIEQIQIHPADHSEIRWFAETEIGEIISPGKPETDNEVLAVRKGFELLRGERLLFS